MSNWLLSSIEKNDTLSIEISALDSTRAMRAFQSLLTVCVPMYFKVVCDGHMFLHVWVCKQYDIGSV